MYSVFSAKYLVIPRVNSNVVCTNALFQWYLQEAHLMVLPIFSASPFLLSST